MRIEFHGKPPSAGMTLAGCLPFLIVGLLVCVLPLALLNVGRSALEKLGLSPIGAAITIFGIVVGALINIPVKTIRRDELLTESPSNPFESGGRPSFRRVSADTLIAVNVGGCLIPVCLAVWQLIRLSELGRSALVLAVVAAVICIAICWSTARSPMGRGTLFAALIPPLASVLLAWILAPEGSPEQRAATAFIAGVFGPVMGTNLVHIRRALDLSAPVVLIGGAGEFGKILLSGVLAALLA